MTSGVKKVPQNIGFLQLTMVFRKSGNPLSQPTFDLSNPAPDEEARHVHQHQPAMYTTARTGPPSPIILKIVAAY